VLNSPLGHLVVAINKEVEVGLPTKEAQNKFSKIF
jgi:hypothetical protein